MNAPNSSQPTGAPAGEPDPAASTAAAPSVRARTARRALATAVVLGVLADPLLRNEPWGLGLAVWLEALAVGITVMVRQRGRRLSRESRYWLTLAVFSGAALAWHDANLLQFFDFVAMLTALTLLAMSLNGTPVSGLVAARVRDLLIAAFGTGIEVATGAVPLTFRDADLQAAASPSAHGGARRVGRALLITVPLLLVFTLLLRNADPVFESYFSFPNIQFGVLASHVVIAGFFAWVVAGWLRRALLADATREPVDTTFGLSLGPTDIGLALGALAVLFAAFVLVQLEWLFGGAALVTRTTGLTYAEYARRGFFELTGVAGLLLPVLLVAQALIPASDARTTAIYRRLSAVLVLLLGAIMVSAGARMRLYVHYYGLSSDRVYASAVMIWLAVVFVWLAVTVLRSRPRGFAAGLVASAFVVLFTLNVMNPDGWVARANLARAGTATASVSTSGGGADPRYLATLGGDAVPALVSALTTPGTSATLATPDDRCAAAETLLKRWSGDRAAQMSAHWTQWNVARSRALAVVAAHEAELRQLACPKSGRQPAAAMR